MRLEAIVVQAEWEISVFSCESNNKEVMTFDFQESWIGQRRLSQRWVPFLRLAWGLLKHTPFKLDGHVLTTDTARPLSKAGSHHSFPSAYCAFTHHLQFLCTSTHKPLSHHAEGLPTGADLSCVCSGGRRKLNVRVTHISCARVS